MTRCLVHYRSTRVSCREGIPVGVDRVVERRDWIPAPAVARAGSARERRFDQAQFLKSDNALEKLGDYEVADQDNGKQNGEPHQRRSNSVGVQVLGAGVLDGIVIFFS